MSVFHHTCYKFCQSADIALFCNVLILMGTFVSLACSHLLLYMSFSSLSCLCVHNFEKLHVKSSSRLSAFGIHMQVNIFVYLDLLMN